MGKKVKFHRAGDLWHSSHNTLTYTHPHTHTPQDMLNGQKLQGVLTSDEVQEILQARGWELEFPLFTTINRIIHGEVPVDMILRCALMNLCFNTNACT